MLDVIKNVISVKVFAQVGCVPSFYIIYMSGVLDGSWRDLSCHLF